MITADISIGTIRVDGLCSERESIADPYIIGIGMGFETSFFLAYGFDPQDALDSFVDSKYGHLVIVEDEVDKKEYEEMEILSYCGNCGEPCQLDEVRILEKADHIDYFAKKDSLDWGK